MLIKRRSVLATVALALGLATPRLSSADNWINPAGGEWNVNSNWGNGLPPGNYAPHDDYGVFSLNSSTGYTVTGAVGNIIVQNDNVTFTNNPIYQDELNQIQVNASAGQVSTLTLSNGTYSVYGGGFGTKGSDGTANINFDSYTYDTSTVIEFGGSGNMTTNVTLSGSTIDARHGISFEGGTTNINVSNSKLSTWINLEFGRTGTITAMLNQVTASANTLNVGIGTANSTINIANSTVSITQLTLGAAEFYYSQGFNYPVTGGGVGLMTLKDSTLNLSNAVVGSSGGNGLLNILSGSKFGAGLLFVGDLGTGRINVSGGKMENDIAYIGANNGNGSVTLSGSTSVWSVSTVCSIGSYNGASGTGLVELDHQATFNLGGGAVNISPTGALEILSGGRVDAGTLNESSGSVISFGLDGPVTSQNGQLDLSGAAIFAGTLNVALENGFAPVVGEQFQLLEFSSELGTFSAVNLPPAYTWDTSQLYSQGVVTVTGLVPEPTSLGFLLTGMGLLCRPFKVKPRRAPLPLTA